MSAATDRDRSFSAAKVRARRALASSWVALLPIGGLVFLFEDSSRRSSQSGATSPAINDLQRPITIWTARCDSGPGAVPLIGGTLKHSLARASRTVYATAVFSCNAQ